MFHMHWFHLFIKKLSFEFLHPSKNPKYLVTVKLLLSDHYIKNLKNRNHSVLQSGFRFKKITSETGGTIFRTIFLHVYSDCPACHFLHKHQDYMTWWFCRLSSALTAGTNDNTAFENQREFFCSSQLEVMSASNRRMRSGAYPLLVPGRGQSSEECTNRDLSEPKLVIAFGEMPTCWEEAHAEKSTYMPNHHLTVEEFQTLDKHSKTKPLEFWKVNKCAQWKRLWSCRNNSCTLPHSLSSLLVFWSEAIRYCLQMVTKRQVPLQKTILYNLTWKKPFLSSAVKDWHDKYENKTHKNALHKLPSLSKHTKSPSSVLEYLHYLNK